MMSKSVAMTASNDVVNFYLLRLITQKLLSESFFFFYASLSNQQNKHFYKIKKDPVGRVQSLFKFVIK